MSLSPWSAMSLSVASLSLSASSSLGSSPSTAPVPSCSMPTVSQKLTSIFCWPFMK